MKRNCFSAANSICSSKWS